MENMVIITDSQYEVNEHLKVGWVVKSVTAQHVATALNKALGEFCFVLERSK